jgi:co-chaperonin GroES (HSP10)
MPKGNQVLIERDPQPDYATEHLIHTPASRRAVWTGTVCAVGPGMKHHKWGGDDWRDNMDLEPGDRIQLRPSEHGMFLDITGKASHVLIDRDYILAKGVGEA